MFILGLSSLRNRQNSQETYDFVVGDRILVSGHRKGTIRFAGETEFASGKNGDFIVNALFIKGLQNICFYFFFYTYLQTQ